MAARPELVSQSSFVRVSQHMIYFDNAATTFPKPQSVYLASDRWMREQPAAFGRGLHSAAVSAAQMVDICRSSICSLLGLDSPRQLAFTLNGTDSLNLILRGLLCPGDRVVASTLDHNSVLRPLNELSHRHGVSIELAKFDPLTGLIDVDSFRTCLNRGRTQLVVINHASNVTGVIQPVAELAQLARDAGALVLLDAAQTAGHIPMDVMSLGVDLLAAPGHKGLMGPLGTGILWIKQGIEPQVVSLRAGGTGSASESLMQPESMPSKFESGNLNLPGIAGLLAGVQWIQDVTPSEICRQINRHAGKLRTHLGELSNVLLYPQGCLPETTDTVSTVGIVSFSLNGLESHDVAMILEQQAGLICRAGLHCAPLAHEGLGTTQLGGTVRLSPGHFTTEAEVDRAIEVIGDLARS
ncbi:MAG: aminotransferase class V-fold PLP-dependent enzyme [Planctomyces sp.]|nr:aminotransferase class V-fold PLP-dependent enzyme [Planctomyces sp.]